MASEETSPDRKKARLATEAEEHCGFDESKAELGDSAFLYIQGQLLSSCDRSDVSFSSSCLLPPPLDTPPSAPIGDCLDRLRELFQTHGFRTAQVSAPRPGLSVYTDRSREPTPPFSLCTDGRRFLSIALGLDAQQAHLETSYKSYFWKRWSMLRLCEKMRQTYSSHKSDSVDMDMDKRDFLEELARVSDLCRLQHLERKRPLSVAGLISLSTKVRSAAGIYHRADEWEREHDRIQATNATLSNAFLAILQERHHLSIHDIVFKPGESRFERLTIFLYDSDTDSRQPPAFTLLPCAHAIMEKGVMPVAQSMIVSLFGELLRLGYFATPQIKGLLEQKLLVFFIHGIVPYNQSGSNTTPISLKARFEPTAPLAFYLHGIPGSGKSSLARYFSLALQETLAQFTDPEYMVRFVKQNLNKPLSTLVLELEIRPNNNDCSLMSIIHSRKQKSGQAKRGSVVLNLEEMPDHRLEQDPDQTKVSQLLMHRFGGRSVDVTNATDGTNKILSALPRNAGRRCICDDFSLVTLFTSNYPLLAESRDNLQHLPLFRDLVDVTMVPIAGEDRLNFAKSFFLKCCEEFGAAWVESVPKLELAVDVGSGDTRPLVQSLKGLSFYLSELILSCAHSRSYSEYITGATIRQEQQRCSITVFLKDGTTRQRNVERLPNDSSSCWLPFNPTLSGSSSLAQILQLWQRRVLVPTVILSTSRVQTRHLMTSLERDKKCHCIRDINAAEYKMSKSLYDRKETPNLRDDILKIGRNALVAVELFCPTTESQLLIREMIEDSPSVTAFSSTQSALFKTGLLFVLCIEGTLSPEVKSRVSFTLTAEAIDNFPNSDI